MVDRWLRKEVFGPVTVYQGDCLDILPALRGQADMIFCDVAYELTSGGNAHQSMGGIFAKDRYVNDGLLMEVPDWEALGGPFLRACKPDADAYIMANDKNLCRAQLAFEGAGWKFHNLLTWNKIRATRNRWYMKNLEFTLYLWKGKADPAGINDCGSKQSFDLNAPKVTDHPTEKPVALVAHYIENSTVPGGLVLDPMVGSGTALVAAIQTGRRAIGIEKDPEWFDLACERAEQAVFEEAQKRPVERRNGGLVI